MTNETLKKVILNLRIEQVDAMIKTRGITREQLDAQFKVKYLGERIKELKAMLEG